MILGPPLFALVHCVTGSYSASFGLMVASGIGALGLLALAAREKS